MNSSVVGNTTDVLKISEAKGDNIMTLVREKRREVALEKESSRALGFLKYLAPSIIILALIFETYIINTKTSHLETQIEMFRNNLALVEQQSDLLNMQIGKMTVGLDVIN